MKTTRLDYGSQTWSGDVQPHINTYRTHCTHQVPNGAKSFYVLKKKEAEKSDKNERASVYSAKRDYTQASQDCLTQRSSTHRLRGRPGMLCEVSSMLCELSGMLSSHPQTSGRSAFDSARAPGVTLSPSFRRATSHVCKLENATGQEQVY